MASSSCLNCVSSSRPGVQTSVRPAGAAGGGLPWHSETGQGSNRRPRRWLYRYDLEVDRLESFRRFVSGRWLGGRLAGVIGHGDEHCVNQETSPSRAIFSRLEVGSPGGGSR